MGVDGGYGLNPMVSIHRFFWIFVYFLFFGRVDGVRSESANPLCFAVHYIAFECFSFLFFDSLSIATPRALSLSLFVVHFHAFSLYKYVLRFFIMILTEWITVGRRQGRRRDEETIGALSHSTFGSRSRSKTRSAVKYDGF